MDSQSTKSIRLEDEVSHASTAFMRQVYEDMNNDFYCEFPMNYDTFTAAEVKKINAMDMKAAQDKYKRLENMFVNKQILQNPITLKLRRQLAPSPPPPHSDTYTNDESQRKETMNMNGYEADLDANLSSNEQELTKNLQRGYARRSATRIQRFSRAKRKLRMQYLAHRMKRRTPEILNARTLIAQAEALIFKREGSNPEILQQLRKVYNVNNNRARKLSLASCMTTARSVDSEKARQFDEEQYTSGDSDYY